MIRRASAIAVFAVAVVAGICATRAYAMDGGRYGEVEVLEPGRHVRGLVIFFSGRRGVTAAISEAALAMTKDGAMVIEVDTPSYLHRLGQLKENCHQLVGDAEGLSHRLQRARDFPAYLTPVLAGVGEGGTIAGLALGQAPAATIAGAVSVDPVAGIRSRGPICAQIAARMGSRKVSYRLPRNLQGEWTIALTPAAGRADRRYVEELKKAGVPVEVRDIARDASVAGVLRSLIGPYMVTPKASVANIESLPLTELPVASPSGLMAVVLSGDGGWRDLDKTIAEDLQHQGVPVVGWDSLRYFWSRKTPDQTAHDLAAVMETYMEKWRADKVALIGYSFGADVLPFAYNRLPEDLRSHVALIALLGLSKSADFEVSVGEILGGSPPGAPAVVPEISRIKPSLIQCFYGQQEKDTACPAMVREGVEVIRTSGGHHFDGDYGALADRIISGFKRRSGA